MMMKKLCILLLLLLLPVMANAEDFPYISEKLPDNPQWTAEMRQKTRLRKVKDMDSRKWLGQPKLYAIYRFWRQKRSRS